MDEQKTYYVGIDISKLTLDIFIETLNISLKVPNTPSGFNKLLNRLKGLNHPFHLVFEASGGYEKSLFLWLCEKDIPRSILNAGRVRKLGEAQGTLAKTDKIDARLIALYGVTFSVEVTQAPSPTQLELNDLINRRTALKSLRVTENNHLEHLDPKSPIAKQITKNIKNIEKQILQIEKWMDALLEKDPQLKEKVRRLCLVPGIAKLSALSFLAYMPELGSLDRKAAAALAGVAPYNCDSGPSKGKRSIRGGRPMLRKSLYMVALAASKYNPILRAFYQNLIKKEKLPKVALTAVMRKIIELVNHILKNPSFQPA